MQIITEREEAEARDILEVREDATPKELEKARRRLCMKYHPDRNPNNPDAKQKFNQVNQAYRLLTREKTEAEEHIERFYGNDGTIWV